MEVTRDPGAVIVTHGLGSCIGVAIYDPVVQVAGLLHYMLPEAKDHPEKAQANPLIFGDLGIPRLFKAAYALGAEKPRIVVKLAGGASLIDGAGMFNVGKRNHLLARKLMWKNGVSIHAEAVGGTVSRTVSLEVATGRVQVAVPGEPTVEL
ncbi:MAG: chemotaxis protein CheD [Nitrospirae bacterium]|nr:MAG: chemotaxis protein CheD [Nitrospirota bacterium]